MSCEHAHRSGRPGRVLMVWPIAGLLLTAAAAGCSSPDSSAPAPTTGAPSSAVGPTANECSAQIDAQVTSREIPNADRDYFIDMCLANR